jgi:2-oxoglutarate ferredoxin oxidoreductase subunit alpha
MPYKRYADSPSGVSPLLFPGARDAIVKVNSYAHDESGTATEDPAIVRLTGEKRRRKEQALAGETDRLQAVVRSGRPDAEIGILCWGSNRRVCEEAAGSLGLAVVRPLVMAPFPARQFREATSGIRRLIAVEDNCLSQLTLLVRRHGFDTAEQVLRTDGRPFAVEELVDELRKVVA